MTIFKKEYNKTNTKTTATPIAGMVAIVVVGSVMLAFSCAPANPASASGGSGDGGGAGGGGGGVGASTAPGAVVNLSINEGRADNNALFVQWSSPTTTGTKSDGTALEPEEIGYRIYYLVGTTAQTIPSAESVRQSSDVSRLEVIGALQTRIAALEKGILYFVTIVSYNSFEPQLETESDEVGGAVVGVAAGANALQVSTYYSNGQATDVIPVEFGQVAADNGSLSLTNADAILTILNLTNGEHSIRFGSGGSGGTNGEANDYSGGSYQMTAVDNAITISKSELVTNAFSFADGAVIGISGPNIVDTLHLATYRPSNIYTHQDLQAMRVSLGRDYVLMRDIVFSSSGGTSTSNYEAVGDDSTPFTGSLDGANGSGSPDGAGYSITGVRIESTNDYQGLFGVIKADSVDTMVAQNLVLNDFKIVGNAYVGSLAGWVKRGTVDNVRVEVSSADAGKIMVGSNKDDGSFGGGLIGRAGTGAADVTDTLVKIQNTSSVVAVSGKIAGLHIIGGLVGQVDKDAMLTGSYATGSVSGSGAVGGLVGANSAGTMTGYATGSVTGDSNVGGLAGYNGGVVTGYATGSATGNASVGGLIGFNNAGTVTGYATGSATGTEGTGGLIGKNIAGTVTGYARGIVRRSGSSELTFGKVIGLSSGTLATYSSADSSGSESQVYNGATGTVVLTSAIGVDGISVDVVSATQMTFAELTFGTAVGKWTWVTDGKWPAINIGDVNPASVQPIDP